MGAFFARSNRNELNETREKLIEKRDVYSLWKLYGRNRFAFDVRVLEIALEVCSGEALYLAQNLAEHNPVDVYNTPGVANKLFGTPRGWYVFHPFGEASSMSTTPGVL